MVIKYIHMSEPEREKIHDTTLVLKNNPFINRSQKEFDEMELKRFEQDKNIVCFEVLKR